MGEARGSAAYLAVLQQKYLLLELLPLAFYLSLSLSFFLENKEREPVRVGGRWLQEFDGRKRPCHTSVETLPEQLGTHAVSPAPPSLGVLQAAAFS